MEIAPTAHGTWMKMNTALLNEYEDRLTCRQINSDWVCSYSFCPAGVCGPTTTTIFGMV